MKNIYNNAPNSKLFGGILFLLVILFAVLLSSNLIAHFIFGPTLNVKENLILSRFLFWFCLLLVWLYSRTVEKQKLLLIAEEKYSLIVYFLSVIAIFALIILGCGIIGATLMKAGFDKNSAKMDQMIVIFNANYFLLFLTAITAGFVEELTFRGYLLPRLALLTKSPTISILLSSVLFGLLHFGYGTVFEIAGPFFIGLVFAFYYYEFRNIKVIIFCHVLWDVAAIFAGIYKKQLLGH